MSSFAIHPANFWPQHNLADEIYGVLEAYNFTSYKKRFDLPPFTAAELAVRAAICRMEPLSTALDMLKWVCHHFSYYLQESVEVLGNGDALPQVLPHLLETLTNVDLPLSAVTDKKRVKIEEDNTVTYSPDIEACRIFLRKHILPANARPFRFMDLPIELRIIIFEFALALPQLCRPGYADPDSVCLWQKEHEDDHEAFSTAFGKHLYKGPRESRSRHSKTIHELFALLFVCKQVRAEAEPVFYQINHFALEFGADF